MFQSAMLVLRNGLGLVPAHHRRDSVDKDAADSHVACFDVYDTILTRAVGRPRDVFLLVAEQLRDARILGPEAAQTWPMSRVAAEASLRKAAAGREVTLHAIACSLQLDFNLTDAQTAQMSEIELGVERTLTYSVPAGVRAVADARLRSRRIAFVSDMYLPEQFIRDLLERALVWKTGDFLFVSSSSGATKSSGALYRLVAEQLSVHTHALSHCGDDPHSDLRVPRKLGIGCRFHRWAKASRYETAISDAPELPARTRSLLAGAAKIARLTADAGSELDDSLDAVAAGVIAPLALSFTCWCISMAERRGLKRLFFLARDGQLSYRIASQIEKSGLGLPPEVLVTRYLHASRQAWLPAAMQDLDETDLQWLLVDHTGSLSTGDFCRRAGITFDELSEVIPGDLSQLLRHHFDAPAKRALVAELKSNGAVRSRILSSSAKKRALLVRYLQAQGATDGRSTALVDVGWHGTLQRSFERVLTSAGFESVSHGLYVALLSRPALSSTESTADAWFIDRSASRLRDSVCNVGMIEQFFEADHGTTLGYQRIEDGSVEPLLKSESCEPGLAWGLRRQQTVIAQTVDQFLLRASKDDLAALASRDMTPLIERLLDQFFNAPTGSESLRFGRFPKESNQEHNDASEMAPELSLLDSARCALMLDANAPRTMWAAGSLMRSGRPLLAHVRRARGQIAARSAESRRIQQSTS